MRSLPLLAIMLLFAPAPLYAQDGLDPVVRLGTMRTVLEKAKTLKVTFESESESEKTKGTIKGTLLLGSGNKARVDLKMTLGDTAVDLLMISDGKTMQTFSPSGKPREKPTDANLHKNMLAMIERAGIAVMFMIPANKGEELLKVSAPKFLEAEKGIYKCIHKLDISDKASFKVELWMDLDKRLPLRRTLEVEKGADKGIIRETYRVEIDPALKDEVFELKKGE